MNIQMRGGRLIDEDSILLSTPDITIWQCWSELYELYNVQIGTVTLHLARSEFETVGRVFKLALGILAARSPVPRVEALRQDEQYTIQNKVFFSKPGKENNDG